MRIRSASWLFAFQVAAKLISFPMGIILARTLGPAGKGSLSVVQLVATTAVTFFTFGLGQAFTFYAARREADGVDVIRLVTAVASMVVVFLLGVFFFFGDWFAQAFLHTSSDTLVAVGVLAAGPALVGGLVLPFVVGSGSVRNASLVSLTSLSFQLIAYASFAVVHRLNLQIAVGVWLAATVGEALALSTMAYRVRSVGVARGALPLLKRTWRYGLLMWISGSLGFTALRADVYLLAFFKGTAAVGVYTVAVTFAELVWFLPTALTGVMVPKVAAEQDYVLAPVLRLSRVLWPVALVAALGVAVIAVPIIPIVFGVKFAGAILPLFLLIPGTVSIAAATMSSVYLLGTGRPWASTIAAAVNVATNVVSNLVLIPRFGIAGAAASSAISYTASAAVVIGIVVATSHVTVADLLFPHYEDFREVGKAFVLALRRAG